MTNKQEMSSHVLAPGGSHRHVRSEQSDRNVHTARDVVPLAPEPSAGGDDDQAPPPVAHARVQVLVVHWVRVPDAAARETLVVVVAGTATEANTANIHGSDCQRRPC